jgi:hypothetical protein
MHSKCLTISLSVFMPIYSSDTLTKEHSPTMRRPGEGVRPINEAEQLGIKEAGAR